MITEAGGLIGNFTGESDFLYPCEVVAATPTVYGQLVQILTPDTRVLKEPEAGDVPPSADRAARVVDALAAAPSSAPKKTALRVRRHDAPGSEGWVCPDRHGSSRAPTRLGR
jgi:myo-inositol-1(or 4)-monophosphatase